MLTCVRKWLLPVKEQLGHQRIGGRDIFVNVGASQKEGTGSSLVVQWVKDLALSLQWLRCRFDPWLRNVHKLGVQLKNKQNKTKNPQNPGEKVKYIFL